MTVKTQFTIKDLENLSGVKAHTIRIWEKRYSLLQPQRTDTNIRRYDLVNLRKLLNVTFLYNAGFKISKIAEYKDTEIQEIISEIGHEEKENLAIQKFKSAMFDFDYGLFASTYEELLADQPFEEIFINVFLPLLGEIGLLWQTGTLDPAHERFISELVKQKIILNIERKQKEKIKHKKPVFVLYLPYEEIHEIGLLYANYLILSAGFHSIYLGNNIPISSLKFVLKHHDEFIFVSYFTVKPDKVSIDGYLKEFDKNISFSEDRKLWLMGSKVTDYIENNDFPHVSKIIRIDELAKSLSDLKKS